MRTVSVSLRGHQDIALTESRPRSGDPHRELTLSQGSGAVFFGPKDIPTLKAALDMFTTAKDGWNEK